MFVAFRADASSFIGTGHVMRCLTLANALREKGAHCVFVCRPLLGNLAKLIETRGFPVRMLPPLGDDLQLDSDPVSHAAWVGTSWVVDAEQTSEVLSDRYWDWLVADHYGLDACWEQMLRQRCRQILVLDDLADRMHDCDLLVDPGAEADLLVRHERCVPASACLYVGPQYALLRPEFDRERAALAPAVESNVPRRLLVMFGGNDVDGNSLEAVQAIANTAPSGVKVDVVVSIINQDQERLESFCSCHPGYALHVATSEVARLMASADMVVASGGGATWERLYLRRPGLLKVIADNQRKPLEFMAKAGYFDLYSDCRELEVALQSAFSRGVKPPPDIVANGIPAICTVIMNRLVNLESPSALDIRRTLYWLQDAALRKQFLMRGDAPVPRSHFQFWRRLLSDQKQRIFSIRQGRRHIGNAGLRNIDGNTDEAELWLYFGSESDRGAGLGKIVLDQLHEVMRNQLACANAVVHVSRKNARAYGLYCAAGYRLSQTQDADAAGFLLDMDVVRMEKSL